MLVLDLARNHAERPIGDVPGDGATKLARIEDPASAIIQRDGGRSRYAITLVEMGAESIDLSHHMRQATFQRLATVEHDPDSFFAATRPIPGREPFGHLDRAGNGRDRDPFLHLAARATSLVDRALDGKAFDELVRPSRAGQASGPHRLHLAVA